MGLLPYLVVVDEVSFLTQNHQRKRIKKIQKTNQTLRQPTIEIEQLTLIATFKSNYSSSETMEIHPFLHCSIDHPILQP